ncbi:glutamine cyclotransferase [Chryseobacterium piperi]|uniref:Glutamine cyclotransferase n=1 Tax=Chryseobacterium piperi TaxID=558152 RepID=A0A086B4K6_9FLAO|nr:glutaminyl-peptide cyclotransferase [Chryseobacterium piperi]ASW73141.1 glutamine cyclotransferase [Chryseobacterium piperi]KFF23870.1 glutamine cyclotransferase [Chryseobacterium piperi]
MKVNLIATFVLALVLTSCKNDRKILNALNDYNNSMESKGYHFGDMVVLPKDVADKAESITISFGDSETSNLMIDPKFFRLGDNDVTFVVKTKDGETLHQDATINVFAKNPEKQISYEIKAEYPHDPNNFIEGFTLEGNTVYESVGLTNSSKIVKYLLGATEPILSVKQSGDIFSEGCAIVGDKIYQLTYQNRKGFIYDKNTLTLLSEFPLPDVIKEGWGLTYDGKNLIATDGSKNLYYLDVNDPSKVLKTLPVAGSSEVYDQLNELEYHDGFIYANVWHKPIILKINPLNGEVVGKFDFTKLTEENSQNNSEYVLNGIAFRGENMLVTGKNWNKIYEVAIK